MSASSSSLLRTPRTTVPVGLSTVLALSATFFCVGALGLATYQLPQITLRDTLEEVEAQSMQPLDSLLAELASDSAADPPPETQPAESAEAPPLETLTVAQVEPVDVPELVHAMTPEDVFAIPPAPLVDDMAKVLQPKPTTPKPAKITTNRRSSTAASSTLATGSTGTGRIGVPAGRCPKPPYPSFARSARMTGTVKLRITGDLSGHVADVSVVSTCGFSALDDYTANYVRKYWHPGTGVKIQPISYRLN